MDELLRAKYIAPVSHAFLFAAMWVLYAVSSQGLADGASGLFFTVPMIMDLPFSLLAFGFILGPGAGGHKSELIAWAAIISWGVGCTLWWYLLGLGLDALIRRKSRQ